MEYWYCSTCGMTFADAAATQEITETQTAALGHEWGEGTVTKEPSCTEEGEKTFVCSHDETHTKIEKIEKLAHSPEKVDEEEASCTEDGHIAYWECTACHKKFADAACQEELTEDQIILHAMHALTAHEAVAATCEEAGNSAYWSCENCGKYFSDAEGKTEVTLEDVEIQALTHDLEHHEAKAATCTEAGNSEYWSCKRENCGKYFSDANGTTVIESIPTIAAHHTLTAHPAVDATCDADGNSEYWSCDVCQKLFSDAEGTTVIESIPTIAAHHTLTAHPAVAETCEKDGNSAYWSCDVCEKLFSDANGTTVREASPTIAAHHTLTSHAAVAETC